ncbi:MAG: hypothetical protein HKN23_13195 [Verrucomicrobiales bacterium]|nr:hypothetical protein [Verrucomicrobiales bacterium]
MKNRFAGFAILFFLLLAGLGLVAVIFSGKTKTRFSPSKVERPWAADDYREFLVDPLQPTPSLVSPAPTFNVDDSKTGEVEVTWLTPHGIPKLGLFGDRIEAGPGIAEVRLPNGQIVRIKGIAIMPVLPTNQRGKTAADRKRPVDWRNPASLDPITEPESVGLPETWGTNTVQRFLIPLEATDSQEKPVRWQTCKLFNNETKQRLGSGTSVVRMSGHMIYAVDLNMFHTAPLSLVVPICYGETEEISIDPTKKGTMRFTRHPAEIGFLTARDGRLNGSSWGGSGSESLTRFRYESTTRKGDWQSFSLMTVWPSVLAVMIDRFEPRDGGKGRWARVTANGGLHSVGHLKPISEVESIRLRQYPNLACCVFQIPGLPGKPAATNLFDVKIGPLKIDGSYEFNELMEDATALQWNVPHRGSLSHHFPLVFDDPDVTPGELLAEYERLTGQEVEVNSVDLKLEAPEPNWLKRFENWLDSTF